MSDQEAGKMPAETDDSLMEDDADDDGDFASGSFDPRCPYCGSRSMTYCVHLVASGSSGADVWGADPFNEAEPPTVCDFLPDAYEDIAWSDEQVVEALGDLTPVLAAYSQYGLTYSPNPPRLLVAFLPFVMAEVTDRTSLDFVGGEFEAEFCYFAPDPDAVRAELADLLTRLRAGFARLATLPPIT